MSASTFRVVGERVLHEGYVISVAVATVEAPDGQRFERDVVHHPGAVAVVAVDGDEAVLVRQFRVAIDGPLLEIVAGKRDVHGEELEVTARREMEEEIGLRAGTLELLATFHNSPGFCDELISVFLATDLTPVPMHRDGIEEQAMTIERVPLDDVPRLIASGELRDAKTIVGLTLARERLGH